jgi:ABC-2 type transport system ATP-binding protein
MRETAYRMRGEIISPVGRKYRMSVLNISNVKKRYGAEEALKGVSFDVKPGRITGLLGPNGSGKTTLIKIITGLIKDYDGAVTVSGLPVGYESKALVSYLPDREHLPDWMRVREAMDMFADFYSDFDRGKAVEMLGQMGVDTRKRIKTLSKGTKEKVALALVIARRARLYVLDEPIAGVDPAARDFILHTILGNYAEDGAILLSTHLINDVEPILDDCILLREGAVAVQGEAEEIRAKEGKSIDQLFREVFKC